jgi:hypothetical protein
MTVRELIERLQTAPPDSQLMIKNTDGTFRPATLAGFHHEDGSEVELGVSDPIIQILETRPARAASS